MEYSENFHRLVCTYISWRIYTHFTKRLYWNKKTKYVSSFFLDSNYPGKSYQWLSLFPLRGKNPSKFFPWGELHPINHGLKSKSTLWTIYIGLEPRPPEESYCVSTNIHIFNENRQKKAYLRLWNPDFSVLLEVNCLFDLAVPHTIWVDWNHG